MKQVINSALATLAIIAAISCGDAQEKTNVTEAHDTHAHDSMAMPTPLQKSVKLKDENLNAVYQHYVHLTTALVNSDSAEAKIAGSAIEAGSRNVSGGNKLASSAAKITGANSIGAQRNEYANLSTEMIALVKKSGLAAGELYIDFCPMAMNDKGAYWLSSKKDIHNPYFGEKMVSCGEVKETISE